eukprot:m51a1_g11933 hypothetical protein (399) ;mRNA; r:708910-710568
MKKRRIAPGTAAPQPEQGNPFECSANDAITVHLVMRRSEVGDAGATFHPAYTHQVVSEDQVVRGYRGLRVDAYYAADTFRSYIAARWDERKPEAPDVAKLLLKHVPEHTPAEASLDELVAKVESPPAPFVPPGDLVVSCPPRASDPASVLGYESYFADIREGRAREYHERFRIFSLLSIDAASYIDASEPGWRAMLLFRKEKDEAGGAPRYRLLGYCTLYMYYHHPDKIRERISQFVVFPCYQKHGYGLMLCDAIYTHARSNPDVFDLTVEDPSTDFMHVRDLADLASITRSGLFKPLPERVDDVVAEKVRASLRICRQQAVKCHEVLGLRQADEKRVAGDEDAQKQYRLRVKARLASKFADWLQDCQSPADRKALLHEIYKEHEQEYRALLASLDKL